MVKEPKDVVSLERIKKVNCLYHVLHGTINPLENKGPNDIRIKELIQRINEGNVDEIIMATNPDVEGEVTASYISKLVKPRHHFERGQYNYEQYKRQGYKYSAWLAARSIKYSQGESVE